MPYEAAVIALFGAGGGREQSPWSPWDGCMWGKQEVGPLFADFF